MILKGEEIRRHLISVQRFPRMGGHDQNASLRLYPPKAGILKIAVAVKKPETE